MTTTVKPTLHTGAPIAIVTDNANRVERDLGKLFQGSNGRILDKALGLANIRRDDCTLTALDLGSGPAPERVKQELTATKPKVCVALGDQVISELVSCVGIQKWRGSILPSTAVPGLKVIPSFTPEWIRRGQAQHFWSLVADLTRAEKQSYFPDIRPPQWTSIVQPDIRQAQQFLDSIPPTEPWCLDIETRAHHLACLSIASGNTAMCFPIQNPAGPNYMPGHEAELWLSIARLMERNPRLVGQNLTFDLEYLFDYGLEPSGILMDTMLSHAILYPEFPKGLDFLCSMYTEMPYYKCLAPNTKVLKSDLTWARADQLVVGDELIGADEYATSKKSKRQMRGSTVTFTGRLRRNCYAVTLEDGTRLEASAEHPWLATKYATCGSNNLTWIETKNLRPGMTISKFCNPWETDQTYNGGWLSGIYDGEGTVGTSTVSFSQNPGNVLERACDILKEYRYNYRRYDKAVGRCTQVVTTNRSDSLSLLGRLRPVRLLPKARKLWEGTKADGKKVKIISIEFLGERDVVGISTSTKTFIAEGFHTHNSEGKVTNPKVTTEDLWRYNNKDTITTLWCAIEIEKQLRARGLWQVHEFVTKELGLALEMQRNRLPVDMGKREELVGLVAEKQAEIDTKWDREGRTTLAKLAGDQVIKKPNVNSPKQVAQLLYQQLKLPIKTRMGAVVADETAISELRAAHPEIEELGWVLEERHLRKLNSSYLNVELEPDGTLGGSWCCHGTETGRWSSGKGPRGRGLNLQTIPKAIRWMCVPPPREAA